MYLTARPCATQKGSGCKVKQCGGYDLLLESNSHVRSRAEGGAIPNTMARICTSQFTEHLLTASRKRWGCMSEYKGDNKATSPRGHFYQKPSVRTVPGVSAGGGHWLCGGATSPLNFHSWAALPLKHSREPGILRTEGQNSPVERETVQGAGQQPPDPHLHRPAPWP